MSQNLKSLRMVLALAVISLCFIHTSPSARAASPSSLLLSLRGKVALLDFWASTCGPCRPALTRLQVLHVRYPKLSVLGVAIDDADTLPQVAPLLQERGVTYPVRINPASNLRLAQKFGVQTYPALFLLDAQGQVVWSHSGPRDAHAEQALSRQVARRFAAAVHTSSR